mmetsp:Transcript_15518/g.22272  ORF Transcript_15518/g.22272 Transcript_15518/m.22272 type:complete len:143 (-) Transcript_15518:401-829(-)
MSLRAQVLSGYRRLFRARRILFEGDERAMTESRFAIRAEFDKNKHVTGPPEHVQGLLTMIDEAEDMLLHGVARGELNQQTGHYEVKIKPEHATDTTDDATSISNANEMEPITSETASKFDEEGKPKVVVTSSSSPSGKEKTK